VTVLSLTRMALHQARFYPHPDETDLGRTWIELEVEEE